MPYQPTYPNPYNKGIDANSSPGNIFTCTIDNYDTITKAELFVYDIIANNKEVCRIKKETATENNILTQKKYISLDNGATYTLITSFDNDTDLPVIGGQGSRSDLAIEVPTTFPISGGSNVLINNKEYKWKIKLYSDKSDVWITDGKLVANSTYPKLYLQTNTRIAKNQIVNINNNQYKISENQNEYTYTTILSNDSTLNNYTNTNQLIIPGAYTNLTTSFNRLYITLDKSVTYKVTNISSYDSTHTTITIDKSIATSYFKNKECVIFRCPENYDNFSYTNVVESNSSTPINFITITKPNTTYIPTNTTGYYIRFSPQFLTDSSFTKNGWEGNLSDGFTLATGSTTLNNTTQPIIDKYYYVSIKVISSTSGSLSYTFGGNSYSNIISDSANLMKATTTNSLIITPASFVGKILVSICEYYNTSGDIYKITNAEYVDSDTYKIFIDTSIKTDLFTGQQYSLIKSSDSLSSFTYTNVAGAGSASATSIVLTKKADETIPTDVTEMYITLNNIDTFKVKTITYAVDSVTVTVGLDITTGINTTVYSGKSCTIFRNCYIANIEKQNQSDTTTTFTQKTAYSIISNFIDSQEYYFKTVSNTAPTITMIDGSVVPSQLTASIAEFKGGYNGNVLYYNWGLESLSDGIYTQIDKTFDNFSSYIYYKYEGFVKGGSYRLTLNVYNKEKSVVKSFNKSFTVDYPLLLSGIAPIITNDCTKKAIKVDISKSVAIPGVSMTGVSGYTLSTTSGSSPYTCHIAKNNNIKYSEISNVSNVLKIPSNFTMAIRFKADPSFSGDIFRLAGSDGSVYKLWVENEYFKYTIGNSPEVAKDIYISSSDLIFNNSGNTTTPRVRYQLNPSVNYTIDNNTYLIYNDDLNTYWWNIFVYNNRIAFYLSSGVDGAMEKLFDNDIISSPTITYKSLEIYGGLTYNYVNVFTKELSQAEKDTINSSKSYTPTWNVDTYMLADFNQDIDASNVSTVNGTLQHSIIFRKNKTNNVLSKVGTLLPDQKAFYDYAVNKQYEYQYLITPVYNQTINGITKTLLGSTIYTDYIRPNWFLISVIGTKSNFNSNESNIYEANTSDVYQNWQFKLNVEPSDMEIVTDKTVYDGLTPFAKVNTGVKNYKKGSVTALLGKIDSTTNFTYTDSVELADKWQEYCNNGLVKLFRDKQGNTIPVDITAKSFKYNDNTMPTSITVSFEWAQIDSEHTVSVYEPISIVLG